MSARLGFWAAAASGAFAIAAFAMGIGTPPRSGPYCTTACVGYPYTNVAEFVPRDYLWMYPAILVPLAFVVLMAAIDQHSAAGNKTLSHAGLGFAVMSAALLGADYFIQLAVMQPSLLNGETDGLSLFSQYNPHGIFVALEDFGYLMMSLAFLCAGAALIGRTKTERALRWIFIVGGMGAVAALIVLSLIFGNNLDYRFEVVVLSINWSVLAVTGVLMALLFRKGGGETAA